MASLAEHGAMRDRLEATFEKIDFGHTSAGYFFDARLVGFVRQGSEVQTLMAVQATHSRILWVIQSKHPHVKSPREPADIFPRNNDDDGFHWGIGYVQDDSAGEVNYWDNCRTDSILDFAINLEAGRDAGRLELEMAHRLLDGLVESDLAL